MKNRTVDGFTFEFDEDLNAYECRGATYYDDEHDQVPEPKLQVAAEKLKNKLAEEGYTFEVEWGEKGWIELYHLE